MLSGQYAVDGENVPCLIYATFSNRIVVYHGIHLSQIGTTNLIKTMDDRDEVHELLAYFNCDGMDIISEKLILKLFISVFLSFRHHVFSMWFKYLIWPMSVWHFVFNTDML